MVTKHKADKRPPDQLKFTNELRRADNRFGEFLSGLVNSVVLVIRHVGEKAKCMPDQRWSRVAAVGISSS